MEKESNSAKIIFYKSPHVLWNLVGFDGEETLVIDEGEETKIYIISGKTGSAIWSRIDGKYSVEDIKDEMTDCGRLNQRDASHFLKDFLDRLEDHGLIRKKPPQQTGREEDQPLLPWPEKLSPPDLSPFETESFFSSDLVALGSFQGALNNSGGQFPCNSSEGGMNDIGGGPLCGAGSGYGFVNAGWFGRVCPNNDPNND